MRPVNHEGAPEGDRLMPATPNEIERHFTQPPDDDDVTCPECEGEGAVLHGAVLIPCDHCDGTGYISAERAAEDAADDWGDQQMELARERATWFEE